MTSLVRTFARRIGALRLFDFGGVEQRCDDRRRPDTDCNTRFDQLRPSFVVAPVAVAAAVAHFCLVGGYRSRPYAEERGLGRVVPCNAG